MNRIFTIFCTVALTFLITGFAYAETVGIEAIIKSIDIKNNTITVERKGKITKFDISKNVDTSQLKAGQSVSMKYHLDLEIVLKIEASATPQKTEDNDAGFVSLFDGKTLKGWKGNSSYWKVVNGAIIGRNPAKSKGQYLVSEKQYRNFILKLKFKLHHGNSGINIRSHQQSNGNLGGSQAEICHIQGLPVMKGKDLVTGALFGTGGLIADMEESVKSKILSSTQKNEWNEYIIMAQGDQITLEVNGITTVDTRVPKGAVGGVIGFQLHRSGTKISFKDIFIKELPD